MYIYPRRIVCTALFGALLASTSSFASPDPVAVADRFVTLITESSDTTVTYGQAVYNPSADTVTIVNVEMMEDENTAKIASINIKGYDETNTEGLTAESFDATGIELNEDGLRLLITSVGVSGLDIPQFAGTGDDAPNFAAINISGLTAIQSSDMPPVSIASIALTNDGFDLDGDLSGRVTLSIDDLTVPAAAIPDPDAQGMLDALGRDSITADLETDLAYDAADETLNLNGLAVDLADLARLDLTLSMGGIGAAMLMDPSQIEGLMATATLGGATISLNNDNLVQEALSLGAQMTGQNEDDLKEQAAFILGMGLGQVNNADFTEMVSGAVMSFLDNPQSLSIAASPSNSVPVAQLFGAAMTAPDSLPELLAVTVTANE